MKLVWRISLLFAAALLAACSDSSAGEAAGSRLDLPLQTLAGDQANLNEYAGNVIVVNFWATWCAPCRTEMPELQAYYDAHREDGLALLAVNDRESAGRVQSYIDEGGYTFPVIMDSDGFVSDYFGGLRGMPTTFVLDQEGEIVYQHVGQLDQSVLDREVTPLLR